MIVQDINVVLDKILNQKSLTDVSVLNEKKGTWLLSLRMSCTRSKGRLECKLVPKIYNVQSILCDLCGNARRSKNCH